MYIPPYFEQKDQKIAIDFMRQYSFATLVTSHENQPRATHLPFIVEETENAITLVSHMAKANPQWKEFADNNCLVIFSEPHAYITPRLYEKHDNVPTWNYVAVHAQGTATLITEETAQIELLEKMILNYDEAYIQQWKTVSEEYKQQLYRGIVAFSITVSKLECKEKLSQNKTMQERKNIAESLTKEGNELGQLMNKKNISK